MPEGAVRTDVNSTGDSFRDGTPVTLPVAPGTAVTLPKEFGTEIPVADATLKSNPVTWLPTPEHFGNSIS